MPEVGRQAGVATAGVSGGEEATGVSQLDEMTRQLANCGLLHDRNGTFNLGCEVDERWDDLFHGEGQPFAEADRERGLKLRLLFSPSLSPPLPAVGHNVTEEKPIVFYVCEVYPAEASYKLESAIKLSEVIRYKRDDRCDRYKKFMLVAQVQQMQSIKYIIPARIGLEIAYSSLDLFAGDLYLSVYHSLFKSLRVLRKRELNDLWVSDFGSDQIEDCDIQGGSKIVDGVADHKGKVRWDGLIGLDDHGALASLWIIPNDRFDRLFGQKLAELPVEIVDVMLGPFNLQMRAERGVSMQHRGISMPESEPEIARRRDEALARLLKMPPKPHEEMKLGKPRRPPAQLRKEEDERKPAEQS
jgi:hypothetical protein